jgi:hypothetical protein
MNIITEINSLSISSISTASVFIPSVDLSEYVKIKENKKLIWYKSPKYVGRNLFLDIESGKFWVARIF